MTQEEYEIVIGKLSLARLYSVGSVAAAIGEAIEEAETQYINGNIRK